MESIGKYKQFFLGMLCMMLMGISTLSVIAAPGGTTIEAFFNGIRIYVDDSLIMPKDANGSVIEPFIYNGTTYLPVRAVANALGKAVTWDGKTQSVYLGKHESSQPSIYLNQLDYFDRSGDEFENWEGPKDNNGALYTYGIYTHDSGSETYNINGQYSRIKGKYILSYDSREGESVYQFRIITDGAIVYTSPEMTKGVFPVVFDVDISGANQLTIEFTQTKREADGSQSYGAGIVDVGLFQ